MITCAKTQVPLIICGVWVGFALPLWAADPPPGKWGTCIYSNSVNDLVTRFDPGAREVGDQIEFGGHDRYLKYFDFEYWGWNTVPGATSFAGAVEARVRFYRNNGASFNGYATPNDPFYDSGWFGGFGLTGPELGFRATIYFTAGSDFDSGGLPIPVDEMTWSVQFRGMGATDTVGVDLYSPPVIGQSYDDYWQNDGTELSPDWKLMTNSLPMDFGTRFYAVPEPSSLSLTLLGGFGILTLLRRMRRAR